MTNSLQDRIKKEPDYPTPRYLIYGREKGGKTTLASEFPNALILDIERGASNIKVDRIGDIKTAKDVYEILCELEKDAQGYKHVVIDSIDWLAEMIAKEICDLPENKAAKDIGDKKHTPFSYGQGWKMVANKVGIILNKLDDLNGLGISPILIAHTKVRKSESPLDSEYDKFELKLSNAVSSRVKEWVDCILFVKDTFHISTEGKPLSAERWVFAEASPAYEGGGRYDIKDFQYTKGKGYEALAKQLFNNPTNNKKGE